MLLGSKAKTIGVIITQLQGLISHSLTGAVGPNKIQPLEVGIIRARTERLPLLALIRAYTHHLGDPGQAVSSVELEMEYWDSRRPVSVLVCSLWVWVEI